MPSAEMRKVASEDPSSLPPMPEEGPKFNITAKDMEGLASGLKENLRITTNNLKVSSRHQLSKRSSRASPYRVPHRGAEGNRNKKNNADGKDYDRPLDELQKLLEEGGLVTEAVRRLQASNTNARLKPFSYESDEENDPPPFWYKKEKEI